MFDLPGIKIHLRRLIAKERRQRARPHHEGDHPLNFQHQLVHELPRSQTD